MVADGDLERVPGRRQAWIDQQGVAGRADPGETLDERLPDAAHRRQVESAGGRPGPVVKVETGSQPQHRDRLLQPPGTRQERGMDARRERAAVGRPRLVEVEVRAERPGRRGAREQVMEHQHVGLLQDLGPRDPLAAQHEVGGDRALGDHLADDEGLQAPEAGALLIESRSRVVAVDQPACEVPPAALLVGRRTRKTCGPAEVPAGHHVRECVVIDGTVVLVRPDHPTDVSPAIGLEGDP